MAGSVVQRRLAGIRQTVQSEGLAANHLQSPTTLTNHRLDHLLSLVTQLKHGASRGRNGFSMPATGDCRVDDGPVRTLNAGRHFGACTREDRCVENKPVKVPGADHPITVQPNPARVVVRLNGAVVADTTDAMVLQEASYPAVQYIPRGDVDMSLLERTDHTTYCPYKGDCCYYSISSGGESTVNAVWSYESPYEAVAAIKDHLAFYPNRVDITS